MIQPLRFKELLDAAIDTQEIRIANLESRLSGTVIPTGDDGYVVDKINYHLGHVSGLRHALTLLNAVLD